MKFHFLFLTDLEQVVLQPSFLLLYIEIGKFYGLWVNFKEKLVIDEGLHGLCVVFYREHSINESEVESLIVQKGVDIVLCLADYPRG